MAQKRDHNTLAASDYDDEPLPAQNKRRREQQQTSKSKSTEAKTDPTYGQRSAFPGLDDEVAAQISDEDLEFEECGDALAYLRAVRQEASHVPHIIVAPRAGPQLPPQLQNTSDNGDHLENEDIDRSIYFNGVGDSRGYYHDGAYTAAPDPDSSTDGEAEEGEFRSEADIQAENKRALREAFYASLTAQFLSLREVLHQTPPPELVAALPKENGTIVGSFGPKSWTFRVWTKRIRYTDPLPVQVAALDRGSVLRIIRVILGGKFIRRGYELRERTSRWLWALLARLPDRGEMDYTEIGWVRELGKRAVLMMISMAHMAALQDQADADLDGEEFEDMDEHGGGDDEVQSAAPQGEGAEDEAVLDNYNDVDSDNGQAEEQPNNVHQVDSTDHGHGDDISDDSGEEDMELDDGEVVDDGNTANAEKHDDPDIAAVKQRLLARLEETQKYEPHREGEDTPKKGQAAPQKGEQTTQDETIIPHESPSAEEKAQLNMRATLNMILTVAGEFYGQRDLLEFRDPFPAV
ncbi:hypothetical protein QBC35DRAFT_483876 [Podospora australis]|uniref:Uncharacterized protein n=1 Tax=Podospora australis TaxID=1536484 RepID=A0AAN6X6Y3_9PEZI|nr:hypothetical protein QBC35DRAFT_483876 [Podospora australis]